MLCAVENIGVTADGEVVVGRRRSHRADVLRPRPQCPGSLERVHRGGSGWTRMPTSPLLGNNFVRTAVAN